MTEDEVAGSGWRWLAGLLADDVLGIPVRPVHIMPACSFLMLAMRGGGAPQRGRELGCRGKGRVGLDTTGKPRGNFLEQPAVAVRIAERGQRGVAAAFGVRAAEPDTAEQMGLVGSGVHVATAVKRLADLCTAAEQFFARSLDIGDDQV
jgi:hypothetical protein